jgi:hypothetical protein
VKTRVACIVLAACGGVRNPVVDGRQDDASIADAAIDTGPNCMTDSFDGSVLAAHWGVLTGAVPTAYDVSGSRLLISDAPFATTPSSPAESWIYDLDSDKANQMAWPQAIGGEDFTLTAELGWSSTLAELTFGGVGVSDALGTIAAVAGMIDDSGGPNGAQNGAAYTRLHVAIGPDISFRKPQQEPGNANVKIQRVSGMVSISIDGVQVMTGAMPGLISNVVIFYIRYKDASTTVYDFGSLELRQVQICRP